MSFDDKSFTDSSSSLQNFDDDLDGTIFFTFIGSVPYSLILLLYCKSRKTDQRHSHYRIHNHLAILSAVNVFGALILSSLILISQHFQNLIQKLPFFLGMFKVTVCTFKNFPLITVTVFHHLLFLSALQRIFLMFNAKLGIRTMTGRRLNLYIMMVYPVAIISAINKIMSVDKMPWLEIGILVLNVIVTIFNLFSVGHIERQPVFVVHKTALAQTAPLVFVLMTLTILKIYLLIINDRCLWSFQFFTASLMSLATPLFLIIGSSAKRKAVVNVLICKEHRNVVRDSYSGEGTPMTGSNVVSMVPTRY